MIEDANYYNDARVRAMDSDGMDRNEADMTIRFVKENDDGEEVEYTLPARFGVCPTCNGKGHHVNPAIDCNGLTSEDFEDDPDFRESYFSGAYDQTCNECGGKRVVLEVDEDAAPKDVLAVYVEWCEDRGYEAAERRAEMRGGY
jgi:predicted methyltransferase